MDTNHRAGRPRSRDVDEATLQAAVDLLAMKGPEAVTINAVARRSGVARASVYLRYPSRHALLDAALRAAIGRQPFPLTGELLADLRLGGAQAQAIFASPRFQAVLPEIVRDLLQQGDGPDTITYDMVAPNRRPLAEEYRRQAAGAGLRTDVDADLPLELVLGALLLHLLADGTPATSERADLVVDVVIDGLRAAGRDRA